MTGCPTCGDDFDTAHGMKVHHKLKHGESLVREKRSCENCGEQFEEFESRIQRGKGRYCSTECKHATGQVIINCKQCGSSAKKPKHRANRHQQSFCSQGCWGAWLAENSHGEDNPNWKEGGIRNYGSNWLETRLAVLNRGEYACQKCGIHNSELRRSGRLPLEVHHIIPLREFDAPEDANFLDNLTPVCRSCHAELEGGAIDGQIEAID